MSLSSGIQFKLPRIPKTNTLKNVSSDGALARELNHRPVPQFPPLTIQQILKLIENGSEDLITPIEWLGVFQQDIIFDGDEQGIRAATLVWQAIGKNERLGRLALFVAALHLDGRQEKFPTFLLRSLDIVLPLISGVAAQRTRWLIALRDKHFVKIAALAYECDVVPAQLSHFLKLPNSSRYRNSIVLGALDVLEQYDDEKASLWFVRCLKESTTPETIELINGVLKRRLPIHQPLKDWLEKTCLPSATNTLWFEVSADVRDALKALFKLSAFYAFQNVMDMMCAHENKRYLNITDDEISRLRSRVRFWSNYSEMVGKLRLIIPRKSALHTLMNSNQTSLDFVISNDKEQDEAVLFELKDHIVFLVLRGNCSEIRLFENISRNSNRFFGNNAALSVSGVRQLACSAIHDHVKLWQYFCEKMLRVQFNITPNPNIQEFSGLRPGLGHYDFRNGLPKPPLKLISERERYLEDWYNAFNTREKRLGNTSNSVSHLTELYKIRKVSGNKKGFRTVLAKAVLNGDSEASYLYSLDLVSDPDEPRNRKKMAESLIKQLAHRGYPLAVKLCEKINLKPNYENVDLKSLVTKDLEEPSFRKNKQRLITLDKIKDDSIKQKLRPNTDRPFVGLYINEFEKLFSEYELNSSELKMVQKELSRRTQNARVKKLSDEVSNKLK
ncbi:EH signature domain-containing protein [Alteromonas hispanica]|uniref:Zorya protein ZorC EH domain-containing protein n=1 Tax=Alteromonas hispanica TaxID=315421 RepID=A0A6L9MQ96_9ALTE|nr:hypothetical protein [Alteromonas hispanica]